MAVPAKAPSLALAAVLVIAWDDAESLETPSLCDAVTTAPLALLDALDDGGCWPCTHTRQQASSTSQRYCMADTNNLHV